MVAKELLSLHYQRYFSLGASIQHKTIDTENSPLTSVHPVGLDVLSSALPFMKENRAFFKKKN